MSNSALQDYITKMKATGASEDQIRHNLQQAGWSEQEINNALSPTPVPPSPDTPIPTPTKGSTSMWDAFEHILLFISMYVLATSITLILHFFVDYWVPKVDQSTIYRSAFSRSWEMNILRGYNAALMVAYPLFTFFFWRITKRTMLNPALRNLRSRKFLIYLTLVITFIIMISYIISTIYSFLSGNLSINFILHLIVTLAVTGVVFAYYLQQVKEDRHYA